MEIIHFGVMEIAEQALVDHGAHQGKVLGVPAFKADAALNVIALQCLINAQAIFVAHGDRLFDQYMFTRVGRLDRQFGVQRWGSANINRPNLGVGKHIGKAGIGFERKAVLCLQICRIKRPAGANGVDCGAVYFFKGFDVGTCSPAVANDSNFE